MRTLLFAALAIGVAWLIYNKSAEPTYELPPGLKMAMEQSAKQAHSDLNGPKGAAARAACQRIAGVSVPADTGKDVIDAGYSKETAIKFVDCVVNYMYPVDAKKDEYYRQKADVR
jgi:hypothetical protein